MATELMTMILAKRYDEWLLAAFAPHLRGCNLSINHPPKYDVDRYRHWDRNIYVWSHAPLDGTEFYPEIRYRGYRAYVWGNWDPETSEPLLSIYIPSHEVTVEGDAAENVRRGQELMDAGLAWNGREGAVGYVHVDELEKTPGPPPEGVF